MNNSAVYMTVVPFSAHLIHKSAVAGENRSAVYYRLNSHSGVFLYLAYARWVNVTLMRRDYRFGYRVV